MEKRLAYLKNYEFNENDVWNEMPFINTKPGYNEYFYITAINKNSNSSYVNYTVFCLRTAQIFKLMLLQDDCDLFFVK